VGEKLRVGVVFGGRSGEHEVSVASAASICQHLDPARYDVVPIHISKSGGWSLPGVVPKALSAAEVLQEGGTQALAVVEPTAALSGARIDVVFPIVHGPYGEDGTVQGLLELAGVPYVGAGVLGSAVGMDKAVMKSLFAERGLPIVPHVTVHRRDWDADAGRVAERCLALGLPLFVKPANLGSSVGISKVTAPASLEAAVALAFEFDRKVVVERGVENPREIECAVLGNDHPEASVPGEIIVTHRDGFYSYDAKYVDAEGARWQIPADLPADLTARVRALSIEAFDTLGLSGLARVDFFVGREDGALYLNEVNTLPGFTAISMYPKLWEATGVPIGQLIDRLIGLAIERHTAKGSLRTSVA
jgi:D-alanine-D-alanine ligase